MQTQMWVCLSISGEQRRVELIFHVIRYPTGWANALVLLKLGIFWYDFSQLLEFISEGYTYNTAL